MAGPGRVSAVSTAPRGFGSQVASDASFRPIDVGGCVLWLRADLGVTVGTGASAWQCQKSGTTFSQATGSKQPTINAADASLNGQRSLSFSPASLQCLIAPSFVHAASSYLCVAAFNESVATGGQYILSQSLFAFAPVDGSGGTALGYYDGAGWKTPAAATTGPQIAAWDLRNGTATAKVYRNGTQVGPSQNYANYALTGQTAIGSASLGTALFFNGSVAELILIDTPTDSIRKQITRYMGARYGIAVTP